MSRAETTTTVFTNLADAAGILGRRGEQRGRDIIARHQHQLRDIVGKSGGAEVKWLGDGIMATFGSARAAVEAATAIQLQARSPIGGEVLRIRIGIHTGEALRDGDDDIFGAAIVTARRLCDAAQPGRVYVSEIVAQLLGDEVALRDAGELTLKGIASPVRAFEVPYAHDARELLRRTPFVGRSEVLGRLQSAFDRSISCKPSVVMLAGEPGIGKTRVAEEFASYLETGLATVLWGHCYEGDSGAPFAPFAEALGRWRSGAAIAPSLRELLSSDRDSVLPAESDRDGLFAAAAAFVRRIAGEKPLVLILDDVHWADGDSLAMLRRVARELGEARVLIVGTYRDTEVTPEHQLAEALGDLRRRLPVETITVRGLEPRYISELVGIISDDEAPGSLAQVLADETAGNPLFMRELLMHLAEEGALTTEGDAAALLRAVRFTEGVREVIVRRVRRLSADCQDMLGVVSALRGGFTWPQLRALTGLTDSHVADVLDQALAAQLMVEYGDTYDFTHGLIRHTLYEPLTAPRRVLLHRRIALALAELYRDSEDAHLSELAHHFRLAAPAGDAARAIDYSTRAGTAANALSAYESAAAHWEAALELAGDEPRWQQRRAELLERLGDLLTISGIDFKRGIAFLEQALEIYERIDDGERAAQVHSRLGRTLASWSQERDIPKALEHARAAERILGHGEERPAMGYLYVNLANAALFGVHTQEGMAAARRGAGIGRRTRAQVLWANAETLHGFHLTNGGALAEGKAAIEAAWAVADRVNNTVAAFIAGWQRGHVAWVLRDPAEACRWYDRVLAPRRMEQAPLLRGNVLGSNADAALDMGDVAAATTMLAEPFATQGRLVHRSFFDGDWERFIEQAERQRDQQHRAGNRWHVWITCVRLARAYELLGNVEAARSRLEDALAIAVDGGHVVAEVTARAELGVLLASLGQREPAVPHVAACEAMLARGEDWRGLGATVALGRALIEKEPATARTAFEKADGTFVHFGLVWERAVALRRWARCLDRTGDSQGASARRAEAAALLERVGAPLRWIDAQLP